MCFVYVRFLALNRRHKPFLVLLGNRSSYSYVFNRRSHKLGSSYLPGKSRQSFCLYCIRETLIRYGGRHLLVSRNALFPWVITMCDVMDLTLTHINDLPRPHSTLTPTPNRSKNNIVQYLRIFFLYDGVK